MVQNILMHQQLQKVLSFVKRIHSIVKRKTGQWFSRYFFFFPLIVEIRFLLVQFCSADIRK